MYSKPLRLTCERAIGKRQLDASPPLPERGRQLEQTRLRPEYKQSADPANLREGNGKPTRLEVCSGPQTASLPRSFLRRGNSGSRFGTRGPILASRAPRSRWSMEQDAKSGAGTPERMPGKRDSSGALPQGTVARDMHENPRSTLPPISLGLAALDRLLPPMKRGYDVAVAATVPRIIPSHYYWLMRSLHLPWHR